MRKKKRVPIRPAHHLPISVNSLTLMPDCSFTSSMCRALVSEVELLVNCICTATMLASRLNGCRLKQYSTDRPSPVMRCSSSKLFNALQGVMACGGRRGRSINHYQMKAFVQVVLSSCGLLKVGRKSVMFPWQQYHEFRNLYNILEYSEYLLLERGQCRTKTIPPGRSQGCWTGTCWQASLEETEQVQLRKEMRIGSRSFLVAIEII